WLWRIKKEPQIWRRYWDDGLVVMSLFLVRVIPLILIMRWAQLRARPEHENDFIITCVENHDSVTIHIYCIAAVNNLSNAIPYFEKACGPRKDVTINFTEARQIDARFLGLILMLRKHLKKQGCSLRFVGVSSRVARIFRLSGFGFLLNPAAK